MGEWDPKSGRGAGYVGTLEELINMLYDDCQFELFLVEAVRAHKATRLQLAPLLRFKEAMDGFLKVHDEPLSPWKQQFDNDWRDVQDHAKACQTSISLLADC